MNGLLFSLGFLSGTVFATIAMAWIAIRRMDRKEKP